MDAGTFGKLISELSTYFERKPPTQGTFNQWLSDVALIPNSAFYNLMGAVKELDCWPKNLPNFLRSKYAQLNESDGKRWAYAIHPRRVYPGQYAKPECKVCNGSGLIVWKTDRWPSRKDDDGNTVYRHREEPCLCPCTDDAEYGF